MSNHTEDDVMHFQPQIRAKARRLLRMPDLADDACQETVLRVLRHFRLGKRFESLADLARFIFSVCHNVVLEMNRQVQPQIPETFESRDHGPNPLDAAVTEERKRLVWKVLSRLRKRDRDLLIAALQEQNKDEVCRRFGVSRDYLRVLLFHARERFRKELEKMQGARTPHESRRRPGLTRAPALCRTTARRATFSCC